MKTITLNLYEFDELSDAAKEKAREWYRRASEGDDFYSECVIDEAVEQGQLLGIEFKTDAVRLHGGGARQKPCIWWSGFSSQGDGACFEGTWRARDVKADKVADGWGEGPPTTEIKRIAAVFADIAKKFPHSSFTVTHRGHYNHENCTEFSFESGADDCDPDQLDRYRSAEDDPEDPDSMPRDRMAQDFPEDLLKENAKDFMRWIYRRLEEAYTCEQSNECVDENIGANEYTFTEDGKRHD